MLDISSYSWNQAAVVISGQSSKKAFMRLLLSAYACEPNLGSEPGFGWNWALHLAKEGHHVLLMTNPHGKPEIDKQIKLLDKSISLNVIYVDIPNWSKRLFKGRFSVFANYYLWQLSTFKIAKSFARDIDLIHHVTWGSIKGGSLLWRLKKPFVFGPIGGGQVAPPGFGAIFGRRYLLEQLRTFYTKKILPINPFAKLMIRNTDLVLCTNRETSILIKHLGAPFSKYFLDTGLPTDFFPVRFPVRRQRDVIIILWVGSLYPRKAFPLALYAVKNIRFPLKLIIVGDGPLRKELNSFLKNPIFQEKVEWWGQVPWERVKEAYLKSDVFIFTSLRDSFGSQILEAMAFGLPIIALNHQGSRDWIPKNAGIKVDVGSLESTVAGLALSIERLHQTPELRSAMGRAGYEFAKQQTWENKAKLMKQYYKNVILNKREVSISQLRNRS